MRLHECLAIASTHKETDMTSTSLSAGSPAPDITLPSLNGEEVNLADFRGKRLLQFFWGSW